MAKREIRETRSLEELTQLFADAGDERIDAVHEGTPFTVERIRETAGWLAVFVSPLALGAAHRHGTSVRGHAVRIPLPKPVVADMALSVARMIDPGAESERIEWSLQAADEEAARAYLAGDLEAVLRRLGVRYRIRMNDRELTFGPLLGTPAESARDLADLVAALPRPTGDEAVLPDFDEAAEADGGVVEAGVYDGEIDAELARGALEAEGIPARAVGGGSAGLWGGTAGIVEVRVLVPRSYAERAEKLLAELDAADDEGDANDDAPDDEPPEEHDRRYSGTAERLRRPERLAWLEVDRVVPLCLEGVDVATVLDVGTGGGLFAEAFAARGLEVAGCDVNEELLEAARAAVPQAAFTAGAAEELPYDDASFDLLFLGHVLHEVDDLDRTLAEARRVARRRVAVLEWPYRAEDHGPPLDHRLRPEVVEAKARKAGFVKVERLELTHMVLYRLGV